jgi:cytochrome o ubiquinol oxidase subunit 3
MTHAKEQNEKTVFGFWLYLMSDCILFATLFAVYAVLRNETFGAAGPAELLNLPFVLVQTLLLLTSSLTVGLALVVATRSEGGRSRPSGPERGLMALWPRKETIALSALAATFVLGAAFVAMEFVEFRHLLLAGEGPTHSASLSAFFALVGTHGLHVTAGLLWLLVIAAHLATRGLSASSGKLWCFALFWHFLDIVWIFIFSFVYLFGALL